MKISPFALVAATLLFASVAEARIIGMNTVDGKMHLKGDDCDELLRQWWPLRQWKQLRDPSAPPASPYSGPQECLSLVDTDPRLGVGIKAQGVLYSPPSQNAYFYMPIQEVLPNRVAYILKSTRPIRFPLEEKTDAHIAGYAASVENINCWNTALYVNNVLSHNRYSSNQEFTALLTSIFSVPQTPSANWETMCEVVPKNEALRPGDILVFRHISNPGNMDEWRGRLWSEAHAATYVSDELLFQKYGFAESHPYMFSNWSENLPYSLTPGLKWDSPCTRLTDISVQGILKSGCKSFNVAYRCAGRSLEDYWTIHKALGKAKLVAETDEVFKNINELESLASKATLGGLRSPENIARARDLFKIVLPYTQSQYFLNHPVLSQEPFLVLKAELIDLRIRAFEGNVRMLINGTWTYPPLFTNDKMDEAP